LALLAAGAAVFVGLGLWMSGLFGPPPASHRYSAPLVAAIGWFAVLFFGLCGAVAIKRMFDSREQLRIGPSGIRYASWSEQTIPWSEIIDVTTWSHRGQSAIVLHLRSPACFPGRGLAAALAGANRGLTGGDISISLTGTDRSFDEAMSAIAQLRR
jgi:hypothetical protein